MVYTIDELYSEITKDILEVYEVFKRFFGEDRTDLQNVASKERVLVKLELNVPALIDESGQKRWDMTSSRLLQLYDSLSNPFILVYWPEVTITNEHDRSVKIQELYAKVECTYKGTILSESPGFLLNRARYSKLHFLSGYDHRGYLHSHVRSIPKHDLREFQVCCLGRGPIINTITTLKINNDTEFWMLFCQELDLYVHTESLAGGPWNRLEDIGIIDGRTAVSQEYHIGHDDFCLAPFSDFQEHFLFNFMSYWLQNGNLTFSYVNDEFIPGLPAYDFYLDISTCFIRFVNTCAHIPLNELLTKNILQLAKLSGRCIFLDTASRGAPIESFIGKPVCTFKGETVTLKIDDLDEEDESFTYLLAPGIASALLFYVLQILNYRYGNQRNTEDSSSGTQERNWYL